MFRAMCNFAVVLGRALVEWLWRGSLWVAGEVVVMGSMPCIVAGLIEWFFLCDCVCVVVDAS